MTHIYLDTSVAMAEAFLKSPYCEAFLKACALLQYTVVIPEIVLDELKGNFPKKYKDASDAFQKSRKELNKLIDVHAPIASLSDATDAYEIWLDEFIAEHGVAVAPYPNVTPKELVQQSYVASKPFKDSGEGHKDYVVWKTITGYIASHQTSTNIFLTSNTKDFCEFDENHNPFLHQKLAEQIEDPAHRPRVYTSIKGAFESELSPHLEGITPADIPNLGAQDIDSLTANYLLEDLPNQSLYGLGGVPFSNEITISSVGSHSIDGVTLKKVDDEIIIKVCGRVEVEVDGFMDKSAYYHFDSDETNIYVVDGDWNDHVMLVSSTIETAFDLTIFYSTENGEVTGYENSLPEEIEDEWPYK